MGQRHLRPKHTNASSNSEGVIVKFLLVIQSGDVPALVRRAEALKVKQLASNNDVKAF